MISIKILTITLNDLMEKYTFTDLKKGMVWFVQS